MKHVEYARCKLNNAWMHAFYWFLASALHFDDRIYYWLFADMGVELWIMRLCATRAYDSRGARQPNLHVQDGILSWHVIAPSAKTVYSENFRHLVMKNRHYFF
jgi:hypothetical protein